jgi:RNA polymerase sigma-70 factor (ECF subfamily)
VARQAIMFASPKAELLPALVNGAAGVVVRVGGRPLSVMGFVVADGRIVDIEAVSGPDRVARVSASVLGDG